MSFQRFQELKEKKFINLTKEERKEYKDLKKKLEDGKLDALPPVEKPDGSLTDESSNNQIEDTASKEDKVVEDKKTEDTHQVKTHEKKVEPTFITKKMQVVNLMKRNVRHNGKLYMEGETYEYLPELFFNNGWSEKAEIPCEE